jgi:hypothetical protein
MLLDMKNALCCVAMRPAPVKRPARVEGLLADAVATR